MPDDDAPEEQSDSEELPRAKKRPKHRYYKLDPKTGLRDYGWVRDPSIQVVGIAAKPPKGHVRQCQGTNRFREQCPKWAVKGSDFCKRHGSSKSLHRRSVAGWYGRHASSKLKERLEELAEASPEERHALNEEIDVARILADRAVLAFDKAHHGEGGTDETRAHLRVASREALSEALKNVSDVVLKATRVHTMSNAVMEMQHIDYVCAQFIKIIEDLVIPLDQKTGDKCLKAVGDIKIPKHGEDLGNQMREALREMDDSMGC